MKPKHRTLSTRELQYWITQNCPRGYCWIVADKIGEMTSHANTEIYYNNAKISVDDPLFAINSENLEYVYFTYMNNKTLITLVQDSSKYYLIRNTQTDELTKSKICITDTLSESLKLLTKDEKTLLNIKNPKLKSTELNNLNGVVNIDFINKTDEQQVELWNKFLVSRKDTLDLSGFLLLKPEVISAGTCNNSIKTIILFQNSYLTDFSWGLKMPNVTTISIWFSNHLTDADVEQISKNFPQLTEIEFHHCYQVTGKILKPLSQLESLSKIVIDSPITSCQENTYTTVLSVEEWQQIDNHTVKTILLNSDNLTNDFTYYLLRSFKSIDRLVVSDHVLSKLETETQTGYNNDSVVFQSFQRKDRQFTRNREVKFKNLLFNKIRQQPYSESMLKIIKQRNPELAGTVEKMNELYNSNES